ncbi:aspartyl-phosphate phosphatase Spo0E family protein [Paenibacillus validus]|uniref:Spo0E family sporulation regulatory protein-aspartic acid phosphatase n=1 Tax=Paenibacillus validus TaxID=44253 RepID=A0A7X2Z793_9BACL|nr:MULTISPECIES: aspartyl-phosphate phosphatase Spo0E family protein [Paenibacillus]MED4603253.1 aspartyl-phosphate phosphatase Spo0E family protein [Paenibacillus validus]MED4608573.1 aspartyl-phosphate phosphatase Spo0E family protein [Paenibacillus validus]MUG69644.1 Spo0E family sporulation regulatory protein-aspartic acid phosphatase [Paenibacillus validus]
MNISGSELGCQIQKCIDDLNILVIDKGLTLTDPLVVKISMELDELILEAMRRKCDGSSFVFDRSCIK